MVPEDSIVISKDCWENEILVAMKTSAYIPAPQHGNSASKKTAKKLVPAAAAAGKKDAASAAVARSAIAEQLKEAKNSDGDDDDDPVSVSILKNRKRRRNNVRHESDSDIGNSKPAATNYQPLQATRNSERLEERRKKKQVQQANY